MNRWKWTNRDNVGVVVYVIGVRRGVGVAMM
jgi:hypothetical protein